MNDKLLSLAEHKTRRFQELATLLEYPEIQADKGYYLSLYNEFESLRATQDAYASFLAAASSLSDLDRLTAQTEEERAYLAEEKRTLFEKKALLRSRLVALLTGGADSEEKVETRVSAENGCGFAAMQMYRTFEGYLATKNVAITEEKQIASPKESFPREIRFVAVGKDAYSVLFPFFASYAVHANGLRGKLNVVGFLQEELPALSDADFKIDLFHSGGAGGQNINKVETAVRVTHLETGIVTTCQDERSQLKNKRRAMETAKHRVTAYYAEEKAKRDKENEAFLLSPGRGLHRTVTENTITFGDVHRTYPFPMSPSDASDFACAAALKG